ncbi:MAG: helix-turn-helix domain-containing protein [Acidobacteriota bacterium]
MTDSPAAAHQREQLKNRLIDAAERVFLRTGGASATLETVAEEAEVSPSQLAEFFTDKRELVLAITHRALRVLNRRFENAASRELLGMDKLESLGISYVEFALESPSYFNAMAQYESRPVPMAESNPFEAACAHEQDELLEAVAEVINVGIRDGSIRDDIDPLTAAVHVWGQVHGLIQVAALKGEQLRQRKGIELDGLMVLFATLMRDALSPKS